MIRFACRCRNVLQAPDDQAGLTVQCNRCGLLVDVPLLSDVLSLEKDGTYKLNETNTAKPDLEELKRVYYPGTTLPDGTEIDMRGPIEPPKPALPPELNQDADAAPRERPKYDPETGELLQPFSVDAGKFVPAQQKNLAEARRVIDYNISPDALEGSPQGLGVLAALFAPLNIIVMTIILGAHVFLTMSIVVTAYVVVTAIIPMAVLVLLISHYGAVLEEMGLWERDELPRPLRNVHPYDDFIAPLGRTFFSLALCYWPMAVVLYMNFAAAQANRPLPFPAAGLWLLGIFGFGSIFFPAIFLTVCTSGTIQNLRPDRLWGVMRHIGWVYPLLIGLWLIAAATYLLGFIGTTAHALIATVFGARGGMPILMQPYIAYTLLMLGIYLSHALCWYLALAYRRHHNAFPWIAQRHEYKPQTISKPLHPKLSAAEQQAKERAQRRPRGIR